MQTDFHPTAKADSQAPLVAYGVTLAGVPLVVVRDLSTGEVVARHEVLDDAVIDAIDGGVVFIRTADGTSIWDTVTGELAELAGPETRVADVRNGVVLYDGPEPAGPAAAALLPGAAARSTPSSPTTVATSSTGPTAWSRPTEVRRSCSSEKGAWFAVDTDGSILVAGVGKGVTHPMLRLRGAVRHLHRARPAGGEARRPDVHRRRHVGRGSQVDGLLRAALDDARDGHT